MKARPERSGRAWPRLPLAFALFAVACDGGIRRASVADAVDAAAPDAGARPGWTAGTCTERESAIRLVSSCGNVRVPERHDDPAVGSIDVRVAILARAGVVPAPEPVVLLDGGAGGSSIAAAIYYSAWADEPLGAFLARRKLIAVDLRGTGGSVPALACDGVPVEPVAVTGELPAGDAFPSAAVASCRQALLGTGATLGAYGTEAAARDLALVVRALGLTRFDLVGVAHGARVALEAVRQGLPGVRALVLDSLTPPDAEPLLEEGAAFAGALERVLAACEADAACTARAPGVRAALPEVVARLAADPAEVATHGASVTLTGRAFLQAVAMSLRDGDTDGRLARHLHAARGGDYAYFAAVLGSPRGKGSVGAHLGLLCAEQMAFTSAEAIEARAALLPAPLGEALFARYYARACPLWEVPPAAAKLRTPVTSSLPTLLLTGALDPVTPPAWAASAAKTLTAARVAELPGHGHAVLHRPCGARLAARFLDDPSLPVTVDCSSAPD